MKYEMLAYTSYLIPHTSKSLIVQWIRTHVYEAWNKRSNRFETTLNIMVKQFKINQLGQQIEKNQTSLFFKQFKINQL
jgi:hypothetical protein